MSEAEDLMSLNAKMTPIIAGLGAIVGDKPAKYSHVIINVSGGGAIVAAAGEGPALLRLMPPFRVAGFGLPPQVMRASRPPAPPAGLAKVRPARRG